MIGSVVAMEPADYQAWLQSSAEGSLALQGRKIFLKHRCLSCHSANQNARAPVLENLYGKPVHLRDGSLVQADEQYLRESILHAGAKIVAGYENIMPTFAGQLSEEDVIALVGFIKSLSHEQTPDRVEDFPPPVRIEADNERVQGLPGAEDREP
jgi:cytochrome c oxidase subunit 2